MDGVNKNGRLLDAFDQATRHGCMAHFSGAQVSHKLNVLLPPSGMSSMSAPELAREIVEASDNIKALQAAMASGKMDREAIERAQRSIDNQCCRAQMARALAS